MRRFGIDVVMLIRISKLDCVRKGTVLSEGHR